jgi:hypothetical protein
VAEALEASGCSKPPLRSKPPLYSFHAHPHTPLPGPGPVGPHLHRAGRTRQLGTPHGHAHRQRALGRGHLRDRRHRLHGGRLQRHHGDQRREGLRPRHGQLANAQSAAGGHAQRGGLRAQRQGLRGLRLQRGGRALQLAVRVRPGHQHLEHAPLFSGQCALWHGQLRGERHRVCVLRQLRRRHGVVPRGPVRLRPGGQHLDPARPLPRHGAAGLHGLRHRQQGLRVRWAAR